MTPESADLWRRARQALDTATLLADRDPDSTAEVEADWEREIADRVAAYERGEIETFAAAKVFAEARRLAR